MSDPREIASADVYHRDQLAGTLKRTAEGTLFEYDADYVERNKEREKGIATGLPFMLKRFPTGGGSVHPFFANLLPEGLRLTALRDRIKTSLDDHFSLLLAVGGDPVGDVCIVPEGTSPWPANVSVDPKRPEEIDFREIFRQSLSGEFAEPAVSGVQEKISGSMVSLPVRGKGVRGDYILKLNPEGKPSLVSNELFFMKMAKAVGIEVPETRLVVDRTGQPGLLVRRFDRVYSGEGMDRLHVEDGCQLLGLYPSAKYYVPVRQLGESVLEQVDAPAVEGLRFVLLFAFSYVIANGDLHAKNVSVLWDPSRGRVLSPAYDLLTTLPYGDQTMALRIGGKDKELELRDFVELGRQLGVRAVAVEMGLGRLARRLKPWGERLGEAGFEDRETEHLRREFVGRLEALG